MSGLRSFQGYETRLSSINLHKKTQTLALISFLLLFLCAITIHLYLGVDKTGVAGVCFGLFELGRLTEVEQYTNKTFKLS